MKQSKLQDAIAELDTLGKVDEVAFEDRWRSGSMVNTGESAGRQMGKTGAVSFDGLRTLMTSIGEKGADPDWSYMRSPASLALSSLSLSSSNEVVGSYVVHADPTAIPEGRIQVSDSLVNALLETGEIKFSRAGANYRVALSPDMATSRRIRASSTHPVYLPIKLSGALLQSNGPEEKRRFPGVLVLCSGGREEGDGKEPEKVRSWPYL